MNEYYIKTIQGLYIHEIRGTCYISWVTENDKENALKFPSVDINDWVKLLSSWTGQFLVYEQVFE